MNHCEVERHRRGERAVVESSVESHCLYAVDHKVGLGVDGTALAGRYVEVGVYVGHFLPVVHKSGDAGTAFAGDDVAIEIDSHVGVYIALHRRSKGIERNPVGNVYVFELYYKVFLVFVGEFSEALVVLCVNGERAVVAVHAHIGIEMFVV